MEKIDTRPSRLASVALPPISEDAPADADSGWSRPRRDGRDDRSRDGRDDRSRDDRRRDDRSRPRRDAPADTDADWRAGPRASLPSTPENAGDRTGGRTGGRAGGHTGGRTGGYSGERTGGRTGGRAGGRAKSVPDWRVGSRALALPAFPKLETVTVSQPDIRKDGHAQQLVVSRGTPLPFAGRLVGVVAEERGADIHFISHPAADDVVVTKRRAATVAASAILADFLGSVYEFLAPSGTSVYRIEIVDAVVGRPNVAAPPGAPGAVIDWGRRACRGPLQPAAAAAWAAQWPALAERLAPDAESIVSDSTATGGGSEYSGVVIGATVEFTDDNLGSVKFASAYRLYN